MHPRRNREDRSFCNTRRIGKHTGSSSFPSFIYASFRYLSLCICSLDKPVNPFYLRNAK